MEGRPHLSYVCLYIVCVCVCVCDRIHAGGSHIYTFNIEYLPRLLSPSIQSNVGYRRAGAAGLS